MTSVAEQLMQEGFIEGEAKMTAKALKARFKEQATPWLSKLKTMKSDQLETVMERIVENKSLHEVFEGVQ